MHNKEVDKMCICRRLSLGLVQWSKAASAFQTSTDCDHEARGQVLLVQGLIRAGEQKQSINQYNLPRKSVATGVGIFDHWRAVASAGLYFYAIYATLIYLLGPGSISLKPPSVPHIPAFVKSPVSLPLMYPNLKYFFSVSSFL